MRNIYYGFWALFAFASSIYCIWALAYEISDRYDVRLPLELMLYVMALCFMALGNMMKEAPKEGQETLPGVRLATGIFIAYLVIAAGFAAINGQLLRFLSIA